MDYSRRNLVSQSALLPLLAWGASQVNAQEALLPSKTYRFEDLPVSVDGQIRTRSVLKGATHDGMHVDLHITDLPPGASPHPPHHHAHEEMLLIHEGALEVTISGNTTVLGPGSVAYIASNEIHGSRNTGAVHAVYFVVAFGKG